MEPSLASPWAAGLFCPWPASLEVQGSSFSPCTMNESLQAPCSLPSLGPLSESLQPNIHSCPGPGLILQPTAPASYQSHLLHSHLPLLAHLSHPTTVSPPGDSLCLPPDLIFHYADRMFSTYSKSFLKPSECSLTILLRPGLCLFSTGLFPGYQMPQQLAKTTLLPRKICPRSLASVISSGNLSVTHPAQNWPF